MLILGACGGGGTTTGTTPTPAPPQGGTATPTPATPAPASNYDLVLAWWGNPTRNQMTEDAVALFESDNPNVSFELQTVGWGDYWTMLATRAIGNDLPDIIQMDWAFLEQYVGNNLLVDLRPFIDSGIIDLSDVPDAIIETGRVGDGIYAISIGMNAASMVYNATLMNELGITVEHNMNTEQFIDIARRVYAETGIRTAFAYPDPVNIAQVLLRAHGIVMFEPDGMGATPEQMQEFFDIVALGIEEGWHIHPEALAGRAGGMDQDPLVFGATPADRTWNAIVYSNMLVGLQNAAPDGMELALTTWPSSNPQRGNYMRASMYFSITRHSNHPEQAARLLDFWTNSIEVNEIIQAERGIPISTRVYDAIAHTFPISQQQAAEFVDFVAVNSTRVNPPRPDGSAEVVSELLRLTDLLAYGMTTPQQAAQDIISFGNNILR